MNPAGENQPFVFVPNADAAGGVDVAQAPTPSLGRNQSGQQESLVDATRREIGDIVREVAAAARSELSRDGFLAMLVDRIHRAMAAEGVIVWQRSDRQPRHEFRPLKSVGRLTEHVIPAEAVETHQRLLLEIAQTESAVVVPPTPNACDDDSTSANPMDVPVAVVTIESNQNENEKEYLLEVFLDPLSGVATQRGYLRFAAQMADLAGEFLRTERVRHLQHLQIISGKVDAAITAIHQPMATARAEATIVDQFADLFEFAQSGLCYVDSHCANLTAVSHVDRIDQRSDAALRLMQLAEHEIDDGEIALFDCDVEQGLPNVAIVAEDKTGSIRLIGLLHDSDEGRVAADFPDQVQRFVDHAGIALQQAIRFESVPGARWFAMLSPALSTTTARRWTKPLVIITAMTLLCLAALFPVPMMIVAPATVRPAETQTLTAPRDAIVRQVHVQHGQAVEVGDPLVTLIDPNLEREITDLTGRRAVLDQQQSRWTNALVQSSSNQSDQNTHLEGQQRLVTEELESIQRQLNLLNDIKASLVMRADRRGTIDGWRLHDRLHGRPLSRGDHLLNVVKQNSGWTVESQVPQNRIRHVESAAKDDYLKAEVYLAAHPDRRWQASLVQVGPSFDSSGELDATTAALLRLERGAFKSRALGGLDSPAGAPAKVVFHCGSAPVAYLLFQDIVSTVGCTARMYLGIANEKVETE